MKIQFVKECSMEVIEKIDEEGNIIESHDETFHIDEIVEGDIFDDMDTYVNFQFGDGSCVFGLQKGCYKMTEE